MLHMTIKPVKLGLRIFVKSSLYLHDFQIGRCMTLFDFEGEPNVSFFSNQKILKGFSFTVKHQSCEIEVLNYINRVEKIFYELSNQQNEKKIIQELAGIIQ